MYICAPCDFFVHRNCIFLPTILKITRHSHRLLRTQIPDKSNTLHCSICQGIVYDGYEGYICSNKTCDYVAHAFCATRSEVWDGNDIEGESIEDSTNSEFDIEVEIYGREIHHVSHYHNLTRLLIDDAATNKFGHVCQACILPIDMGSFLCCKQCDYALHDTCARLPIKMEHMLHRHPLDLQNSISRIQDVFTCSICKQYSCGFMYRCFISGCNFKIDVKCASFVEPFYHTAHQHPLFLKQQFDDRSEPYECTACSLSSTIVAACSVSYCRFTLDFKCATLPGLIKCKYDTHPLTLSSVILEDHKISAGVYISYRLSWPLWCEICETKMNQTNLFYMCIDCCTTVHVECLLGEHYYLKPGHMIIVNAVGIDIVSNNGASRSRPTCHTCQRICKDKLVFIKTRDGVYFCSINYFPSSTGIIPYDHLITHK